MTRFGKTLLVAAVMALGSTGCSPASIFESWNEPSDPPPHEHEAAPLPLPPAEKSDDPMPRSEASPQIGRERACGAFDALEGLARTIIAPPAQPVPGAERPQGDLIAVANALNAVDRRDLSPAMNAAIRAHAVALTNLGALVNHKASREDVQSMSTVAIATGSTLRTLCQE